MNSNRLASFDEVRKALVRLLAPTKRGKSHSAGNDLHLQSLEDRVMYDASPLGAFLGEPLGDPISETLNLEQLEAFAPASTELHTDTDSWSRIDEGKSGISKTLIELPRVDEVGDENQLLVVDRSVENIEQAIEQVIALGTPESTFDVLRIDNQSDALTQIGNHLRLGQTYSAVHVVSHGAQGAFNLGDNQYSVENIASYQPELSQWSSGLTDGADLLFYGCNVAGSAQGESLLQLIGDFTQADVAASNDLTGNEQSGGDWELEFRVGHVESDYRIASVLQQAWTGTLEQIEVTTTADIIDENDGLTSLREAIILANSTETTDKIFLGEGTYQISLVGDENESLTGDLDITNDLQIIGVGDESTFISGNGADRVFDIFRSTLTASNLTISDGHTMLGYGGGIHVNGGASAILEHVTIHANSAVAGGGIYNVGNLELNNVTFTENIATDSSTNGSSGAITNAGSLSAFNVDLISNSSTGQKPQIENSDAGTWSLQNVAVAGDSSTGFDANSLTLNEGQRVILTPEDLQATGAAPAAPDVFYRVSDVVGGSFEFANNPGHAIFQFSQEQLSNGAIAFAHDGGELQPEYIVNAWGAGVLGAGSPTITFSSLDEASQFSDPPLQTIKIGESLTFNDENGNAISFSDPDSNRSKDVTLIADHGTIELSSLKGLTVMWGANGTEKMTVRGFEDDINAALQNMRYQHDGGDIGNDTIRIRNEESEVYDLNIDESLETFLRFDSSFDVGKNDSPLNPTSATIIDAAQIRDGQRYDVLRLEEGDHLILEGMMGQHQSLTLSAWVNLDAGNSNAPLASLGDNIKLTLDQSQGGVTGAFWNGTEFQETTTDVFLGGSGWHHVAYSIDQATGQQRIYVDGLIAGQSNHESEISYSQGTTSIIGALANSESNQFFVGSLDEVRVFGRSLSAAEVSDLANDPATKVEHVSVNIQSAIESIQLFEIPQGEINEDGTLIFGAKHGNPVSISGPPQIQNDVSLAVAHGSLSLAAFDNITISAGSNDSSSLTISGLTEDINAALDGLEYVADANFSGTDSLQVNVSQRANTATPPLGVHLPFDDADDAALNEGFLVHQPIEVSNVDLVNDETRGSVLELDGENFFDIDTNFEPTNVTLAGWVNLASGSGESEFISLGDNVALRLDSEELGVHGFFYNGTDYNSGTYSGVRIAGTGWQHVAYVVDQTNNHQALYINGTLFAQTHHNDNISYELGTGVSIGHHGNQSNESRSLTGLIDEVRVYDAALSATEIRNLFVGKLESDSTNVAIEINPVDDAPIIVNNQLVIVDGEIQPITNSELFAYDIDNADLEISFAVSNLSGGQFESVTNPGIEILSFTQEQIDRRQIIFKHDGFSLEPSYDLSVTNGTGKIAESQNNKIVFENGLNSEQSFAFGGATPDADIETKSADAQSFPLSSQVSFLSASGGDRDGSIDSPSKESLSLPLTGSLIDASDTLSNQLETVVGLPLPSSQTDTAQTTSNAQNTVVHFGSKQNTNSTPTPKPIGEPIVSDLAQAEDDSTSVGRSNDGEPTSEWGNSIEISTAGASPVAAVILMDYLAKLAKGKLNRDKNFDSKDKDTLGPNSSND